VRFRCLREGKLVRDAEVERAGFDPTSISPARASSSPHVAI
jgi:hypothetical protein